MKSAKLLTFLTALSIFTVAAGGCGNHEFTQTTEYKATDPSSRETESASGGISSDETESASQVTSSDETESASQYETESASAAVSEDSSSVSLIMVGDILLHSRVEEGAQTSDGSYDFSSVFANTRDTIRAADLALVNEEVIIGGEELGVSGYPSFNAPYEIADALVDAGFDVSCQATNHALDKGKKGLLNCIDYWETTYPQIGVLGIHDSANDADEIYTTTINGITLAILNYTYSTNGNTLPDGMPYAVDLLDKSNEDNIREDLRLADEIADFVIVCPHWGTEYEHGISKQQEYWTDVFLEEGVDLVLGTHPHVIEPVEMVTDDETGAEMLVYYSLGNFVSWTSGEGEGRADRSLGGMAEVTVEKDDDGNVTIGDWSVEPLVCHVEEGFGKISVYPLSDYTTELEGKNAIKKQDSNFSIAYMENLVEEVWPFLENE